MDFTLSEEAAAVVTLGKQILRGLVTPEHLAQVEATEDRVDDALWAALAKAELLGCALPEEVGGSDFGFLALCLLIEQAGRVVARAPLVPTLVMGALPVARFGDAAQRARLLPSVVKGERMLTGALLEWDADADGTALATRATQTEGGWRVDGAAAWVPLAQRAHRVLVPAVDDDGRVGLFLVDPAAAGVEHAPQVATDGTPVGSLTFAGALVPDEDVLLAPGPEGAEALGWILAHARAALSALSLGVAYGALIMTARYASEREQFGRPIGTFQAVAHRAADGFIDVEAMRLTTWQAAWRLDQGLDATEAVHMAAYWAAEGSHRVVHAAQHIHGGMGFDTDYPLHRHFLRAKHLEMVLGSAGGHLAALGRRLTSG